MSNEEIYKAATAVGCIVRKGVDGVLYCGCTDLAHHTDSQCSMLTLESITAGVAFRERQ